MLPGATVDLGVTSKPIYKSPWVQEYAREDAVGLFTLLPIDRSATFACIAYFESGSLAIKPSSLENVMAIVAGGSIYIAAPLLSDPSEVPREYEVKRIRGSIGKPGIALLIPPQNTQFRQGLESEHWNLVNHNPFDGKLEDSFSSTTMYLWFTEYVLPLDVGDHGSKSFEIYFLESVVSVHDKGKWVADLDIIKQLEGDSLVRILRDDCAGHDHGSTAFEIPIGHHKLTTIDDWNELLDGPEFVGIVRSHDNWLGRLATASLSAQLGYRTFVLPKSLCWTCVATAWVNLREGPALERNAWEFHQMEAKEILELMSGLVLVY
ncbi:hypothetical protein DL765_008337 [Monosporascus sp. GIB2]|nr:hypothetical protein DL765_008337 [Monosporascus sp. GIB2]